MSSPSSYSKGKATRRFLFAFHFLLFMHLPFVASAATLSSGSSINETLTGAEDEHTFFANEGETVVLSLSDTGSTSFYPQIMLYGPNGDFITYARNSDVARIMAAVPATGEYRVVVENTGSTTNNYNYELHFANMSGMDEHGGLINGGSVSETMTKGDVDTYNFEGNTGENVFLSMTDLAGAGLYPEIRIFAPDGQFVTYDRHPDAARATITLDQNGTYTVVAFSAASAATGDYEIHFAHAPGANEHGALVNGGFIPETITRGDLDTYTFQGNAGENVMISMTDLGGAGLYPELRIYAPNGQFVTYDRHPDAARTTITLDQSGIYTVLAFSTAEAATGDYEIHFAHTPGANEHGALVNGGLIPETITRGDIDTYTFQVNAGENVMISMTDLAGAGLYPELRIYAPDGRFVTYDRHPDAARTTITLDQSGIYTVLAFSTAEAATGDYEIHFAHAPGANEHGALVNGGFIPETITRGDLDTYTFEGSAGENVMISLVDLAGAGLYPELRIYAPDGEFVTYDRHPDAARTAIALAENGTYTVVAFSTAEAATGDYEIHFAHAPEANEHGSLIDGGYVSENITKGDLDTYQFQSSSGQDITINMIDTDETNLYPEIRVYDPDGEFITYSRNPNEARLNFRAAQSGIYTVLAFSTSETGTGNYQLGLNVSGAPVVDVNDAPNVQDPGLISLTENVQESLQISATDPDNDTLALTVENLPAFASFNDLGNGTGEFTFEPGFDTAGDYTITVTATETETAEGLSDTEVLNLSVLNDNRAPVAVIGLDQTLSFGSTVDVNGTGSNDPDGDSLSFAWRFLSKPAESLLSDDDILNRLTPLASFTPDIAGFYQLELVVSDGELSSAPVNTIITIEEEELTNIAPVANAGSDVNLVGLQTVNLDGSASSDADSQPQPLSYSWTLIQAPASSNLTTANISDASTANASLDLDAYGEFVFRLSVSDGVLVSTDEVVVSVENLPNQPPVVDAGADQQIILGQPVTTAASANDPDQGPSPLELSWTLVSQPDESTLTDADLTAVNDINVNFTPDAVGFYLLQVSATDGEASVEDQVLIEVTAAATDTLSAPEQVLARAKRDKVNITWASVADATRYTIYRKLAGESEFTQAGMSENLVFEDTIPQGIASIEYYVTAGTLTLESEPSETVVVSYTSRR